MLGFSLRGPSKEGPLHKFGKGGVYVNEASFEAMATEIEGLLGRDLSVHADRSFVSNAVHGYSSHSNYKGAVSFPLFQTATFAHPALYESTGFAYSRCGNPTVLELENTIALLEGGLKALAFSSGLAAITCILGLFSSGEKVVVSEDLYGGTYRLFNNVFARQYGVEFIYVDTTDLVAVERAAEEGAAAFFIETPSNPMMKVTDLRAVAEIAHAHSAIVIVDNTFLTCYFQKPFDFGADLVVYSGTKYLCGHNDVTCGFVVIRDSNLLEPVFMSYMSEGAALGPFDAWLMLRSLKTLALRLEKQQSNARALVPVLKSIPAVEEVFYAGDENHPQYSISTSQASGFGAMISFNVDSEKRAQEVLRRVRLITFAESLGGCESLITYPLVQTHGAMPEEKRSYLGVGNRLLRLSVGIEDVNDIIKDIETALG